MIQFFSDKQLSFMDHVQRVQQLTARLILVWWINPPALLNPIPPETFAMGEAFNFKIAANTFYDEQGKPIRLSSALANVYGFSEFAGKL